MIKANPIILKKGAILFVIFLGVFSIYFLTRDRENFKSVRIQKVSLKVTIQATGNVEPLNKVSILPPVAGRMENILVEEGQMVRRGETIAWMSSTNRAALLDIAQIRSPQGYEEWAQMYQPTPLMAPVDGRVISRKCVPGQTVAQTDTLFEISDLLVVRAQVDETDIDKIKEGMKAVLTVDAYPDHLFQAHVNRVGHQSELVNNVNIYQVELFLENSSDVLRSGMTANVDFIIHYKPGVLAVPVWAVQGRQEEEVVVLDARKRDKKILLGLADEKFVEVLSPAKEGEEFFVKKSHVEVESQKLLPSSPFDHRHKKKK